MYFSKYIKYKAKYLGLKQLGGNDDKIILVHIDGNIYEEPKNDYDLKNNDDVKTIIRKINIIYPNMKIKAIHVMTGNISAIPKPFRENILFYKEHIGEYTLRIILENADQQKIIKQKYHDTIGQLNILLHRLENNDTLNIIITYSFINSENPIYVSEKIDQQIPIIINEATKNYKKINIILTDLEFNKYKINFLQPFMALSPKYNEEFDKRGFNHINMFDFDNNYCSSCNSGNCIDYYKHYENRKKAYLYLKENILGKYPELRFLINNNLINFYTVQIYSLYYNRQEGDTENISKIKNLIIQNFTGEIFYNNSLI